jgi:uncharacterized protein (DUF1015 family)
MATIAPLRALRYNPQRFADLSAVTAPPYDVIGPPLQAELLAEPANIVWIDHRPGSIDPSDPDNRYAAAADTLAHWRAEGLLVRDAEPAIYLYEQDYEWAGQTFTRRSMIARVRLEELGAGHIHPHEQTFSGPKEDRFQLTRATRCLLSQHLGIYPDADNVVLGLLAAAVGGRAPDMTAVDRDGVANRVWAVTDPAVLAAVTHQMADRDVFIADGHHRYETMLRYQRHLAAHEPLAPEHPANYTVFVLTGSGDAGLCVMPTHRVAVGWPNVSADLVAELLAEDFEASVTGLDPRDGEALEACLAAADLSAVGLLTTDGLVLLTPRRADWLQIALGDLAPALRGLNVSVLHGLILPRLTAALGETALSYVHRAADAVERLAEGAEAAFLLRATPLEAVLEVARAHGLMPQKSTYFYPKVLTGLVLYPLDQE